MVNNKFGGKIFGKINIIDFGVGLIVILGLLGLFLLKSKDYRRETAAIKELAQIEFDVMTKPYEVTAKEALFVQGEKSFLTIRNVPYTGLEIVNSKRMPAKSVLYNPVNPKEPVVVNNIAKQYEYSYLVTLKDKAVITPKGPVVGGNKIKIGLPVNIEGSNYRFAGYVSDVRILKSK